MKVRALQDGFFGGNRIRAGKEFEVPEGTKGRWFAPLDDPKASKSGATPAKGGKGPRTLSQMAGGQPQSMTQVLDGGKGDNLA